jgi:hypothetical protein
MTALPLPQAIENIYTSLQANNDNLDAHIAALKEALTAAGQKEAVFDPARLAQGNRQGRRLMESYFAKRGVKVAFKAEK